MDEDFVKWLYAKAEGFQVAKYSNNHSEYYLPHREHSLDLSNVTYALENDKYNYSLLLQRAIEGVNRTSVYHELSYIKQNNLYVAVVDWNDDMLDRWSIEPLNIGSIDKAKESALRYIYEQEKKDEIKR